MKFSGLGYKNRRYNIRFYRLVSMAALIAVAVITGSLVVGDSVRTTLIKRVSERLGDTETILFSHHSFMAEELSRAASFGESARGVLMTGGFIPQGGRLLPVVVWGTDDMSIPEGTAKVNISLAKELGREKEGGIVLRLPAPGLVPSGSLFVTENYTAGLRLSYGGTVQPADGGNISLKNEQAIPLNIFVNRGELAGAMQVEGKINLVLSPKILSAPGVGKEWDYTASGLSVGRGDGYTEITSGRIFLQKEVVESIVNENSDANRLFSYLASSITLRNNAIPYSFVTAIDRYGGDTLRKDEIILSDYSAKRLQAKTGDTINVSYYISKDLKTLVTQSAAFRVKKITPVTEWQEDKTLSANFPGLSDVERCTDWDSDLPIDMSLITGEDEEYWERYRSTPKALIAYDAVAADWSNAYGSATAIRVAGSDPGLSGLRPGMFGIRLIYPREAGIYAAKNGVDFSGLFLALGFFIIVSAMLLMFIPLSEMLYRRRDEIALMHALGFTRKRIFRLLWVESAPLVLISSILGVIAGLIYTSVIMWLLGNVWKGATHTGGFSVYPSALTIIAGFNVALTLSFLLLRQAIVRALKQKQPGFRENRVSLKAKKMICLFFTLVAVAVITVNSFTVQSAAFFVAVGIILIVAAALWGDYLIGRFGAPAPAGFRSSKHISGNVVKHETMRPAVGFRSSRLILGTLFANRKQSLFSFCVLAAGVFIVFSVGLNRRGFSDSAQLREGTGGYSLWCESAVPVYHNMATVEGREKLSLTGLPAGTEILQCFRFSADDASCLNLNKTSTPTVLGVDMNTLSGSGFRITQSLYPPDRNDVFRQMRLSDGNVYPALVDATVLTWSLMKNLGDTLWYTGGRGETVGLRLAGTMANSVFQGNVLIDRNLFGRIWGETAGSEVFLLKVGASEKEAAKNLLSQALNEYGARVSDTDSRLREFNTVTDTYLTIFLTLGGLGLLLGIMSFVIVIRKNLAMRRGEINIYRNLGFTDAKIEGILYRENLSVPLCAIATGIIGALAGVNITFLSVGVWVWLTAFLFALLFIGCVVIFVGKSVKRETNVTEWRS